MAALAHAASPESVVQVNQKLAPASYDSERCNTFVAILDDDDEWTPDHVRLCFAEVTAGRADGRTVDWVVPGIRRDNGRGNYVEEMATSETLTVASFLR
jgi:hypothetical protein